MNMRDLLKNRQKKYIKDFETLNTISNINEKIEMANKLALDLTYANGGYWFSKDLEKFYLELAKNSSVKLKDEYKPNSFLHVMTTAYLAGGHTRVVEKWIGQADSSQTHSVVLINQYDNEIPEILKNNIHEKNGELIVFDETDLIKAALKLREIASGYEYVILHTHMEDPTALVAFGNPEFKRPVIFYNHADHLFWLGKSIIDKLAELRSDYCITVQKRNIKDGFFLGVPMDFKFATKKDKNVARESLGLSKDKKVILCVGTSFKFRPLGDKFFGDILLEITKQIDDVEIIVIGISPKKRKWAKLRKLSCGKIKNIEFVKYGEGYFDYVNSADLVLDSWPMGGGTVMIDALSCNVPVLSLENLVGQFDYLKKSKAYCKNKAELIEKCKMIFENKKFAEDLTNVVRTNLIEDSSMENWSKRLNQLIEQTPKTHSVKDISSEEQVTDLDIYVEDLAYIYRATSKNVGIKGIFEIIKYETYNSRVKVIKFFNCKIYKKKTRK